MATEWMNRRGSVVLDAPRTLFGWIWHLLKLFARVVAFLFPRQCSPTSSKGELHPTAYLDSLRGYAAWIVVNGHILPVRPASPWTRIFFNGFCQVATFYVISGFVLTYSGLRYVHRSQPEKVLNSMASSIFRRWFRLFVPTVFATFLAMMVIATGLGAPERSQPTFWGNVWFWIGDSVRFVNPFRTIAPDTDLGLSSAFLIQTWTIPVEFRGSMVVFLFLGGVSKLKPWVRSAALLGSVVVAFYYGVGYATLFLFGMWLADLRLWREQRQQQLPITEPDRSATDVNNEKWSDEDNSDSSSIDRSFHDESSSSSSGSSLDEDRSQLSESHDAPLLSQEPQRGLSLSEEPQPRRRSWIRSRVWCHPTIREIPYFFLIAIYLLLHRGKTSDEDNFPIPFKTIAAIGLEPHLWIISTLILCFAMEQSSILKKPFETSFSLWLGEMSFGIYVMHNTVRYALWDNHLMVWQSAWIGTDTFVKFLPAYFVFTVVLFWSAEGFRWVDTKCVNASKALAGWAFT